MKPLTVQKCNAVLRKAGHRKSILERSSMVRGWATQSCGYRCTKSSNDGEVIVWHHGDVGEWELKRLEAYKQSLVDAGLFAVICEGRVIVSSLPSPSCPPLIRPASGDA